MQFDVVTPHGPYGERQRKQRPPFSGRKPGVAEWMIMFAVMILAAIGSAAGDVPRAAGAQSGRCPEAVPPVQSLQVPTFYIASDSAEIDNARNAVRLTTVAPLRQYFTSVLKLADRYRETKDQEAAQCALAAMDAWAKADALSGTFSMQGEYERKWAALAIAIAYLKIRPYADVADPETTSEVRLWLARLGERVRRRYAGSKPRLDNHLAWAGTSVMALGLAADNEKLVDWGVAAERAVIGVIDQSGYMPYEIRRGPLSVKYHLFAATALTIGADLAKAREVDLYADNNGGITRLANRLLDERSKPGLFERRTGVPQQWSRGDIAWAYLYGRSTSDKRATAALAGHRTVSYLWTGNLADMP